MKSCRPITLLTDFGLDDPFVGIMKGVILGIAPEASVIDICHDLPSYDIAQAAFLLHVSYPYFPPETIHVVVIDPGVGSSRRPLLAAAGNYFFIGPDNGVLSYVFSQTEGLRVFEITASHYFLSPPSSTFHGRDVFAPVAAYLSKRVDVEVFGEQIQDFTKIPIPVPQARGEGTLVGEILRVDRFGNLLTNISHEALSQFRKGKGPSRITIGIGEIEIPGLRSFFSEGEKGRAEAIMGSLGYLEVFVREGNASSVTGKKRGDEVRVILS